MYQSKIIKSAIRTKKTTANKFVPLIKIDNDKISTQRQGLQVLKKITSGSLLVVAFQQNPTQLPYNMFECFELNNPRNQTGIWISQNYIEDQQFGYKLICLVGNANSTQDTMRIHMFNSILASVVIINVFPGFSGYNFLKAIDGRVKYGKTQKQNAHLAHQLANLVILQRDPIKDMTLRSDDNRLKSIQRQQGIINLKNWYRSANFYMFPQDEQTKFNKRPIQELYNRIIAIHLQYPKQSKKLQYGPVLAEYIPQIVKEYNSKYSNYTINYTDCLNRIQIDQGYQAYMEALQHYNDLIKNKFKNNKQPVQGLDYYLKQWRQQAIYQYKLKNGDMEYLTELNNTITDKQLKIHKYNDDMWRKINIDILKSQSRGLINYAQNPTDLNFDVRRQTERIKKVYNQRAGGRTKQQDLNGFLQKLSQTLGQDNYDKNRKINQLQRQRRNLQDRLKKLQKGGCCAKCQIM